MESVALQTLDLNALALEVTMEWVPEALRRNVDLGFEGADGAVIIDGDAHRLRELINNLIDNAVRYSQDMRPASRSGWRRASSASCRSATTGRASRWKNASASSSASTGCWAAHVDGSGLGLAIVSEIAALHKAHITLEEDLDGVGNTFTVFFPAPPRAPGAGTGVMPELVSL